MHNKLLHGLLYGTPWTCCTPKGSLAWAPRLKIQRPFLRIFSSKANLLGYTQWRINIDFRLFEIRLEVCRGTAVQSQFVFTPERSPQ